MKELQKYKNWLLCHVADKIPLTINKKWIDNILKDMPEYFNDPTLFITDKSKWLKYVKTSDTYTGDLVNSGSTIGFSGNWLTFEQVQKIVKNSMYLFPINVDKQLSMGVVITKELPYTVIDLDRKHADELQDSVKDYQNEWIKKFDSYTERSVSGKGYHVIIKGKIDEYKYPNVKGTGASGLRYGRDSYELARGFEVYSQDRFITVTLNLIDGYPFEIKERQKQLDELCEVLKSPTKANIVKDEQEYQSPLSQEDLCIEVNFIIDSLMCSEYAEQFYDLYNNRCNYEYDNNSKKSVFNESYTLSYPSQSEADIALISLIYKATKDSNVIKSVFKCSKLGERAKANRNDYLDSMIHTVMINSITTADLIVNTTDDSEEVIDEISEQIEIKKQVERQSIVDELINDRYLNVDATTVLVNSKWSTEQTDPDYSIKSLFTDILYATGIVEVLALDNVDLSSDYIEFNSNSDISFKRLLDKGYINTKDYNINSVNSMLIPPLSSGLLYELTKWSYKSRIKPVLEVSLTSAIGFLAGICGKMWQLPTHAGLNLYTILCARSGIGKEGLHTTKNDIIKQIQEYMSSHFTTVNVDIGRYVIDQDFVSGQALMKHCASVCATENEYLPHYVSFCNFQKEFGKKLSCMSDNTRDNNAQSLRSAFLSLYTGSADGDVLGGMTYSDKEKNVKSCYAPSFSIVGETTINGYADALSPQMASDGFLSRFVTITYNGKSVHQNYDGIELRIEPTVLKSLVELCNQEAILSGYARGVQPRFVVIQIEDKAKEFIDMIENLCLDILDEIDDKEHYRQSWNRCQLKILKLAGLCAVCQNFTNPIINLQHVVWATRLVFLDIAGMYRLIMSGESNIIDNSDKIMFDTIQRTMFEFVTSTNLTKLCKESKLSKDKVLVLRKNKMIPLKYLVNTLSNSKVFIKSKKSYLQNITDTIRYMIVDGTIIKADAQQLAKKLQITGEVYQLQDVSTDLSRFI